MDIDKIIKQLQELCKHNRIIFWQDDGYFEKILAEIELELDNVVIINTNLVTNLEIKVRVELEQINDKFIIYRTTEVLPDDDWLLNIKCYAKAFSANPNALTLQEFGLDYNLIPWMGRHFSFFKSKDRRERFKKLLNEGDEEAILTIKLLAVSLRIQEWDHEAILTRILSLYTQDKFAELEADLENFGLIECLWNVFAKEYAADLSHPQLIGFIQSLLVSDFYAGFTPKNDFPATLKHYVLETKLNNIVALFSHLRDRDSFKIDYLKLSQNVAEELAIELHLQNINASSMINNQTFLDVDRQICQIITRDLASANIDKLEGYKAISSQRKLLFWARNFTEELNVSDMYDGLIAAINYLLLSKQIVKFIYSSADECFTDYTQQIYLFDLYYRQFVASLQRTSSSQLKYLSESLIEPHYTNTYLPQLSSVWDRLLIDGFLDAWQISDVSNQYSFYHKFIHTRVQSEFRTVVIISDGMRFEVAKELQQRIAKLDNYASQITPLLGVLPSYTKLGMAALLPNAGLSYRNDMVYIDDMNVSDSKGRDLVLNRVSGQAIIFSEFNSKTIKERKEFINQKYVTYIYHNLIDATGDKPLSEHKTAGACADTIDELIKLISSLTNNYMCSRVYVTSDHGFTFQSSSIGDADINRINLEGIVVIQEHKRFKLLDQNLKHKDFPLIANLSKTSGVIDSNYHTVLANRHGRFNLTGGAKYTHGGASLQEIVIPVVEVNYNSKRAENKISLVAAKFNLSTNFKVTTYSFNVEVFQCEAISSSILADDVSIEVLDENNNSVSDVKRISLTSTSHEVSQRMTKVSLALKQSISYSRAEKYRLTMRGKTQAKDNQLITIDIIGFDNDF
ncbi:MAG: BREX-1 system phosphatase PglZ type A [Burkholderiales bacterium]|nr:BREX-1 system phosphatase PglZ type A [Burkholderiales bacterium]